MTALRKTWIGGCILIGLAGCSYGYYAGMHGTSIRNTPDIHDGVTEDSECLDCHHPEQDSSERPTTHPQFSGCLKCHNDPL